MSSGRFQMIGRDVVKPFCDFRRQALRTSVCEIPNCREITMVLNPSLAARGRTTSQHQRDRKRKSDPHGKPHDLLARHIRRRRRIL